MMRYGAAMSTHNHSALNHARLKVILLIAIVREFARQARNRE